MNESKNAGISLLLNLTSLVLPGAILKDLAIGALASAIEYDTIGSAVNALVPRNDLALNCKVCRKNTHYYIQSNSIIKCASCFENNLEKTTRYEDKIYVLKNGIYQAKKQNVGAFKPRGTITSFSSSTASTFNSINSHETKFKPKE